MLEFVLLDVVSLLPSFEADVPHMYLDAKGNVTVGVGHLLPTVLAAFGLPFLLPSGSPAEQHDILNDYQAIKHSIAGHTVAYYAQIADLRLSSEDRRALLWHDVHGKYEDLECRFDLLRNLPSPAQKALLDMAFQLGVHGLLSDYPKLIAACRDGNWQQAAAECFIQDAQPARNEANKNFFLSLT